MCLQDHYDAVKAKLVPAVAELKSGNPKDEDVFVGPLISEKEAKRIEDWIQEASSRGTLLLCLLNIGVFNMMGRVQLPDAWVGAWLWAYSRAASEH